MCGFVGFLGGPATHGETGNKAILQRMSDTIANRGPDDAGYWCDAEHPIGFGHRRLSIVDLSAAGHQPMLSASGRYVISLNGEIYNHLDLRQELESSEQSAPLALVWEEMEAPRPTQLLIRGDYQQPGEIADAVGYEVRLTSRTTTFCARRLNFPCSAKP